MKIAAIVVTYNRKELLRECLESLLNQSRPLETIILVNNASTDGTEEMLSGEGYLDNTIIHYIKSEQNTGGAGGFHSGIQSGIEMNFDWLWIMDDDCIPFPDALELLITNAHLTEKETVALCNQVLMPDGSIHIGTRRRLDTNLKEVMSNTTDYKKKFFEIHLFSFVGVLLRAATARQVGLPRKEYFIFFDDTEYSFRCMKLGKIYVIPESKVLHKSPLRVERPWQLSWRDFFLIRNPIHMYKTHIFSGDTTLFKKIFLFFKIVLWQSIIKPVLRPLVIPTYHGQRFQYLKLSLKAVYQGVTGNFINNLEEINKLTLKGK